jgi:hypothetical protein
VRLLSVRVGGVLALIGLYLVHPVLGVVALAASFTYTVMRQRAEQPDEQDSLVSLNLSL